jgi:hypothetical protein
MHGNRALRFSAASLPPEILEPIRRQFGIADGMLDVFVAEISLECAGVMALIRQREPAGVAKHVRVRLYAKVRALGGPLDHPGKAGRGERCAALRDKHEPRRRFLAVESAQSPQFVSSYRMDARGSLLHPADMEVAGIEIDLRPFQCNKLGRSEAVAVGDKDHSGIAMAVPIQLRGCN